MVRMTTGITMKVLDASSSKAILYNNALLENSIALTSSTQVHKDVDRQVFCKYVFAQIWQITNFRDVLVLELNLTVKTLNEYRGSGFNGKA
jgi:hypothetical protein